MIGAFRSGYCFLVPRFPQGVLVQIFSYCGHPRFRYFGSVVPVYVFALSLM